MEQREVSSNVRELALIDTTALHRVARCRGYLDPLRARRCIGSAGLVE